MVLTKSEEGFVLVTALMLLLVLTLLGLATIMTSTVELKIAGNDRLHKKTFYQADGGTETGAILAYENALCINAGGFTAGTTPTQADIGCIRVTNLAFADPGQGTTDLPEDPAGATPAVRDAVYYSTRGDDSSPHTNFTINGIAEYAEGSGLQMDSGYPGLGQGSAGGGTHLRYTVNSQRIGELGSRSAVSLQWRMSTHLINSAGSSDCKY